MFSSFFPPQNDPRYRPSRYHSMVAFGFLGHGLAADSPFALLCQPLRPWMGALHGWDRKIWGGGWGVGNLG